MSIHYVYFFLNFTGFFSNFLIILSFLHGLTCEYSSISATSFFKSALIALAILMSQTHCNDVNIGIKIYTESYLIQYDYHAGSSNLLHQNLNLQQLPPNRNCEEVLLLHQFELVDTVFSLTIYYGIIIESHLEKWSKPSLWALPCSSLCCDRFQAIMTK